MNYNNVYLCISIQLSVIVSETFLCFITSYKDIQEISYTILK